MDRATSFRASQLAGSSRLSSIQEMRDCPALVAVADAIEAIRSHVSTWGEHMKRSDPEEFAKTERILGCLIDLHTVEIGKATREGETMNLRRAAEARAQLITGEAA
jgi:hypothetical protein